MARRRAGERREFWCGEEGHDPDECRQMWREHIRDTFGRRPRDHWFFGGRRFRTWLAAGGPAHMNPFVGLVLSKGGGLLPLYVLHLLWREPRYGNDIMRELEDRSQGTWASNPGAIYPLLRMLEHHGLLQGEWEDPDKRTRRVYRLTAQGEAEYQELRSMMQPGLREALQVLQSFYEELYPQQQPAAT
jgi:PadR family transcriptional regulator PadR